MRGKGEIVERYLEEDYSNEELVKKAKELIELGNYKLGLIYLNEAYLNKDGVAAYELAICYNEGIGVEIDALECFFYEEEAAKYGYLLAQEELAKRLLRKSMKSVIVARYWLRKAALQNSIYSLFLYSLLCYKADSILEANKYFDILEKMGFDIKGFLSKKNNIVKDLLYKLEIDEFINLEEIGE